MREPRHLIVAGSAAIILGLLLGGVAAALTFIPVTTHGSSCGTLTHQVFESSQVAECLSAVSQRQLPAVGLAAGAIFVLLGGVAVSLYGARLERQLAEA